MVHTFVAEQDQIERHGKPAYAEYLRVNIDLQSAKARGFGLTVDSTEEDIQFIVSRAVNRMINQVGLIGTPSQCLEQATRFAAMGIDELACLIDFGVEDARVLSSLEQVALIADKLRS